MTRNLLILEGSPRKKGNSCVQAAAESGKKLFG